MVISSSRILTNLVSTVWKYCNDIILMRFSKCIPIPKFLLPLGISDRKRRPGAEKQQWQRENPDCRADGSFQHGLQKQKS